jgi:hypothetical protein
MIQGYRKILAPSASANAERLFMILRRSEEKFLLTSADSNLVIELKGDGQFIRKFSELLTGNYRSES